MNLIVSVDKNWGIGKDNELLFHIPADMAFFKEKTIGNVVVMGKNTLMSLPESNPLPKRENIILSKTLTRTDCTICNSIEQLFSIIKSNLNDNIYVIGGAEVYKLLLPYCDTAYVTKVDVNGNATCFFPDLDKQSNWTLKYQGDKQRSNGYVFELCEYKNRSVKVDDLH
jgi:dihydrofolate reductase